MSDVSKSIDLPPKPKKSPKPKPVVESDDSTVVTYDKDDKRDKIDQLFDMYR